MKRFSIIKRAYIWVILALCLGICVGLVFFMTANYSEEFTGWVNISIDTKADASEIQQWLSSLLSEKNYGKASVHVNTTEEETQIKINADLQDDNVVAQLSTDISDFLIKNWFVESSENIIWQTLIWPSVWDYMKTTAFQALIIGLVLMVWYILLAFQEIRKYISPAVLSGAVLCVMLFDILATLWAYWVWMLFNDTLQVDTIFIIWVLTVIGYGINDVIVIFDRVRENIVKHSKKEFSYIEVFEESIWQTLKRSIGTSISTLLVLCGMFIFGTGVIQRCAFTVGVWVIASFLSSVFVAIPTAYILLKLLWWKKIK